MNVKNFILSLIAKACSICVGISLLFFAVAQIITYINMDAELGISFSQYLLFIFFSFVLAGASYLFRLPLPKLLNLIIHYLVCLLSFFITFIAWGKLVTVNPSVVLVFSAIFTLLYALFFGVYILLRFLLFPERRKQKSDKKKEEAAYQNRF